MCVCVCVCVCVPHAGWVKRNQAECRPGLWQAPHLGQAGPVSGAGSLDPTTPHPRPESRAVHLDFRGLEMPSRVSRDCLPLLGCMGTKQLLPGAGGWRDPRQARPRLQGLQWPPRVDLGLRSWQLSPGNSFPRKPKTVRAALHEK